jgi:predicted secreted protein
MKTACRSAMLVVGAVAVTLALAGCWGGNTVAITETGAGTIVAARLGDRVVVRLGGNPSTGYAWSRVAPRDDDIAASPLDVIEEGEWHFPNGGHLPGEPGICTFEYRAERAGIVTLTYEYARSWEGDPVETFSVTVWARE